MADVGILGGDAVRGNPDGLAALGRSLDDVANRVAQLRAQIAGRGLEGTWVGLASGAFHGLLHDLPAELQKVTDSYSRASGAVLDYSGRLHDARARASWIAAQLEAAEGRLVGAQRQHDSAQTSATAYRRHVGGMTDPVLIREAGARADAATRTAAGAQHNLDAARSEISDLRRQAHDNRQALEQFANHTEQRLHDASDYGIKNSLGSYLSRHVGGDLAAVAGVGGAVGQFAADIVVDTAKKVGDIGNAVSELISHPGSWEHWKRVLEDVSAVLTVVAIVVAIVAVPFTGGTSLIAFGAIEEGLAAAQFGIAAVELEGDAATGASAGALTGDAIGLGLSAVKLDGAIGGATEKQAALQSLADNAGSKGAATRYLEYGAHYSHYTTKEAAELMGTTGLRGGAAEAATSFRDEALMQLGTDSVDRPLSARQIHALVGGPLCAPPLLAPLAPPPPADSFGRSAATLFRHTIALPASHVPIAPVGAHP